MWNYLCDEKEKSYREKLRWECNRLRVYLPHLFEKTSTEDIMKAIVLDIFVGDKKEDKLLREMRFHLRNFKYINESFYETESGEIKNV